MKAEMAKDLPKIKKIKINTIKPATVPSLV